jgi:hypothetical protein
MKNAAQSLQLSSKAAIRLPDLSIALVPSSSAMRMQMPQISLPGASPKNWRREGMNVPQKQRPRGQRR